MGEVAITVSTADPEKSPQHCLQGLMCRLGIGLGLGLVLVLRYIRQLLPVSSIFAKFHIMDLVDTVTASSPGHPVLFTTRWLGLLCKLTTYAENRRIYRN